MVFSKCHNSISELRSHEKLKGLANSNDIVIVSSVNLCHVYEIYTDPPIILMSLDSTETYSPISFQYLGDLTRPS